MRTISTSSAPDSLKKAASTGASSSEEPSISFAKRSAPNLRSLAKSLSSSWSSSKPASARSELRPLNSRLDLTAGRTAAIGEAVLTPARAVHDVLAPDVVGAVVACAPDCFGKSAQCSVPNTSMPNLDQ
eukprot:3184539-Pleurochrysis_carterae.AAC.2